MIFSQVLGFFSDGPTTVLAFFATTAVYFGVYSASKFVLVKCNENLPPVAPLTSRETLQLFFSNKAPQLIQELLNEMNEDTIRFSLFGGLIDIYTVTRDVKLGRKILTDAKQIKSYKAYQMIDYTLGGTVFIGHSSPERCDHVRKSSSRGFGKESVQRFTRVVDEQYQAWIDNEIVGKCNDDGIDINDHLQRMTIKIIAKAGFEYDATNEEAAQIIVNGNAAMREHALYSGVNPLRRVFWPLWESSRNAHAGTLYWIAFGNRLLSTFRERRAKGEAQPEGSLMAFLEEDLQYKDDDERIRDVLLFFIAGYETTANSLCFVLLELGLNSDEQQKVRDELLFCKDYNQSACLRRAIRESMRLHATAALGSGRITKEELKTESGRVLPKGTDILITLYHTMRNPKVFKDADTFAPDRWIDATATMNEAYFPFALGRRNCVGQSLANAEMFAILGRLLTEYEIEVLDAGVPDYFVTLKATGARIRLVPIVSKR